MFLLRVVGLLKTILLLIAIFVIFRLIARILNGRKVAQANKDAAKKRAQENQEKKISDRSTGRVNIEKNPRSDAEDVDFEEIK
jgi:hypothetical protein